MFDRFKRREVLDQKPVAIPLKYTRKPPMDDHIKALVRGELSRAAELKGMDTFEEANDFVIEEEYEPKSPYEIDDDLLPIEELRARQREAAEAAKVSPSGTVPEVQPAGQTPPAVKPA